jgi:DoxX-like protein
MKFGVAPFRSYSRTNTLVHSEEHFMQPASQTISKSRLWTGRIISTILVLFLLFDAIAKLLRLAPVLQAFDQLGWSRNLAIPLGIVLLTCTLLYMIPYTSALGALLLTAYLGGAVATHLRAGQAFYFPIVFGILLWVGLVLRNDRLRILPPLQG